MNELGRSIYQFEDDVSWICNLFYFVWVEKTTHFNVRRDEWDDVQKAYQIIFTFCVWFRLETFRESMFYVENLRGK